MEYQDLRKDLKKDLLFYSVVFAVLGSYFIMGTQFESCTERMNQYKSRERIELVERAKRAKSNLVEGVKKLGGKRNHGTSRKIKH